MNSKAGVHLYSAGSGEDNASCGFELLRLQHVGSYHAGCPVHADMQNTRKDANCPVLRRNKRSTRPSSMKAKKYGYFQ